jgi:NAD(P)-dependent dehydrogenase (short-subunit alcohol dehydrogenase family)
MSSALTAPNVFITGGGRGIGRSIALRFAREGSKVVVAARTSPELDAVVVEIDAAGGKGLASQMNLRDHGSIEAAVFRAGDFFGGRMDLLVNNAGTFAVVPLEDMDPPEWDRMMEVNLTGPFLVTLECLPQLQESERGQVVNVASRAARQGFAGNTAYCASKYGLRGFSDALREELGPKGLRVSTVFPGQTDTGIFDGVPGDWDRGKMNRPEDVAEVVWQAWQAETGFEELDVPPPG